MKSVKTFSFSSLFRDRIMLILLLLATTTRTTRLCLATNNETAVTTTTTTTIEETSNARTRWHPRVVICGDTVCKKRNEYCCNESCGICAPINGSCIEKFCIDKPVSVPIPHRIIPRRIPRRIPRKSHQPRPRYQLPIKTKITFPPIIKRPFCNVDEDCTFSYNETRVQCITNECVVTYEKPPPPP